MNYTGLICGNDTLQLWDSQNGTFGRCSLNLALTILHGCFAALSAFYVGQMRARRERIEFDYRRFRKLTIVIRFLVSFVLFLTISTNSLFCDARSAVSLANNVFGGVAWFTHLICISNLGKVPHRSSRGPLVLVLLFVAIIFSNCLVIHEEYVLSKGFHDKSWNSLAPLCIFSFHCVYLLTLLPNFKSPYREQFTTNQQLLDSYIEVDGEESANFLSKISFWWVNPLMKKGFSRRIERISDLFALPETLQSRNVYKLLVSKIQTRGNYRVPFWRTLARTFQLEFFFVGLLKFSSDILSFGGPVLINKLLLYLESDDRSSKDGFYYTAILFASVFLSAILNSLFNFYIGKTTLKIRSSIIMHVYNKLMTISEDSLNERYSSGEIINFVSTDSDRITNFCPSLLALFSCPLQLLVTLYLLYQQLGLSFLAGVGFAVAVLPINKWICNLIGKYSTKMMAEKDARIKLMSEILDGIKVIKMHGWEKLFMAKVEKIRSLEVDYLKKRKYLDAFCVFFWATTPVLISLLTFTTYVLLGNTLSAAKVFTSLALFNMLIMPLNAFPWVLNGLVEARVSLKRLEGFFKLEDLDIPAHYNATLSSGSNMIVMQNATFSRLDSARSFLLGPINLKIKPKSFIGIIGKTGSGKSTLLKALIGEVPRLYGTMAVTEALWAKGIGYLSQEPWIQNTTIRENILFGKIYEYSRYQAVVDACALNEDFKTMASGDSTIVGDKGMALSGGQKSRISLARALYQDFDVYVLDDIFSSVDAIVAETLNECLTQYLSSKVRILSTHHEKFLQSADFVIALNDGKVIQCAPLAPANEAIGGEIEEPAITWRPKSIADVDSTEREGQVKEEALEEERESGVVKLAVYKCYLRSVGYTLAGLVFASLIVMQVTRNSSDLWLAYWTAKTQSSFSADLYLEIFGAIALINLIATLFRSFLFAYSGVVAAKALHSSLIQSVLQAQSNFFDKGSFGKSLNRFSSDTFNCDDALPFTLNIFLAQCFSLLGSIVVTVYGLPWIFFLIVLLAVPYYFIQNYYRWTSRELKRLSSVSLSPMYAHLTETLGGLAIIRCYLATERFVQEMFSKLDLNNTTQYSSKAASEWLNLRLQILGVAVTSSVAFASVCLHYWHIGTLDSGLIGLALAYSLSLTGLLNGVIQSFTSTETDMVSVERVQQFVEGIERERENGSYPLYWPSEGCIVFANVSFRYGSDLPLALKQVTFTVMAQEHIGIVGRTGSGKSSLFKVLFGLVEPEDGSILIDNVNLKEISLNALRSNIFIIPQDPFLFTSTVRENCDPLGIHDDSDIWESVRDAHIEELVTALGGLDATISGNGLSCGQKQLLCLARALLYSAKVVCLDEATAQIDSQTESLIRKTIKKSFRQSTVLTIAHKIESVMDCDKVLVMDSGKVLELDAPDRLLQKQDSLFYRFWQQQLQKQQQN